MIGVCGSFSAETVLNAIQNNLKVLKVPDKYVFRIYVPAGT